MLNLGNETGAPDIIELLRVADDILVLALLLLVSASSHSGGLCERHAIDHLFFLACLGFGGAEQCAMSSLGRRVLFLFNLSLDL